MPGIATEFTPRGFHLLVLLLLLGAGGLVSAGPVALEAPRQPLVFGFLPIVSSEHLVRRFAPLVDYLAQQTGIEIRMETAPSFREFIRRTLEEDRYDLLFTAPHLFYLAQKERGYRALVRVDLPGMYAVIVAPASSDIRHVEDLRNRRLATTDPLALATVLVRNRLLQAGLNPDKDLTLVSTPSHNASLLSSYQGTTDACALIFPLFRRSAPEIRDNMRMIAKTESTPHMPIAAAPWLDAETAKKLQATLVALNREAAGKRLLKALDWPGFRVAQPDEYQALGWAASQISLP